MKNPVKYIGNTLGYLVGLVLLIVCIPWMLGCCVFIALALAGLMAGLILCLPGAVAFVLAALIICPDRFWESFKKSAGIVSPKMTEN